MQDDYIFPPAEERQVAMRNPRPLSVLLVATVSAGVQGGLAVFFVPTLSFLFALSGITNGRTSLEYGMVAAIAAPILSAACGFLMGGFAAFLYNMWVSPAPRKRVVRERKAPAAPVTTAAFEQS